MNVSPPTMVESGQHLFNGALMGMAAPLRKFVYPEVGISKTASDRLAEGISDVIGHRTEEWTVAPQNKAAMERQMMVWDILLDYYFRSETTGWERLPARPVHARRHPFRHLADHGRLDPVRGMVPAFQGKAHPSRHRP